MLATFAITMSEDELCFSVVLGSIAFMPILPKNIHQCIGGVHEYLPICILVLGVDVGKFFTLYEFLSIFKVLIKLPLCAIAQNPSKERSNQMKPIFRDASSREKSHDAMCTLAFDSICCIDSGAPPRHNA